MMQAERERHIHARLFSYASYKEDVKAYRNDIIKETAKKSESGIRGSFHSDPTARIGIMLADAPDKIKEEAAWIRAIENAWAECHAIDNGNPYGLAYLMEKNFCLTGESRPRSRNAAARWNICRTCNIAERTFYLWLSQITSIVMYHAARERII